MFPVSQYGTVPSGVGGDTLFVLIMFEEDEK
jgi:hypothetical protein